MFSELKSAALLHINDNITQINLCPRKENPIALTTRHVSDKLQQTHHHRAALSLAAQMTAMPKQLSINYLK